MEIVKEWKLMKYGNIENVIIDKIVVVLKVKYSNYNITCTH